MALGPAPAVGRELLRQLRKPHQSLDRQGETVRVARADQQTARSRRLQLRGCPRYRSRPPDVPLPSLRSRPAAAPRRARASPRYPPPQGELPDPRDSQEKSPCRRVRRCRTALAVDAPGSRFRRKIFSMRAPIGPGRQRLRASAHGPFAAPGDRAAARPALSRGPVPPAPRGVRRLRPDENARDRGH